MLSRPPIKPLSTGTKDAATVTLILASTRETVSNYPFVRQGPNPNIEKPSQRSESTKDNGRHWGADRPEHLERVPKQH